MCASESHVSLRAVAQGLFAASLLAVIACEGDDSVASDESSYAHYYAQSQVDRNPELKALQRRARNVDEYEINVADIGMPGPSAEGGTSINGFATYGLDWFQNPEVEYPDNKTWSQGSDTGKKCQWAAVFRFNAIFSDPPPEAIAMRDLPGGKWHGDFWSWTDDYASTNLTRHPTRSYAWSKDLWKWIGASGKDGLCRLPTKKMVAKMMASCLEVAQANRGNAEGCEMPDGWRLHPSAE